MAKLPAPTGAPLDLGGHVEFYSDGIVDIEQYGANAADLSLRAALDGRSGRVIVVRVIVPTAELARMARQLTAPGAAVHKAVSSVSKSSLT